MKTTLELPNELLAKAKAAAVRQRTTLRALITHALERELRPFPQGTDDVFEIDEHGLPHLPARGTKILSRNIHRLLEDEDS